METTQLERDRAKAVKALLATVQPETAGRQPAAVRTHGRPGRVREGPPMRVSRGQGQAATMAEQIVSLFLNDLTRFEVVVEQDGDRQMVRGLPLMRPGEFNDQEYSAADLTQMANNFDRLRDELAWVPSLKPRHTYDLRGRPENVDARDVLARFDALNFDADEEVLFGDVEVVDATMIADMESKKLLYLSTEVARYVIDDDGEEEDIGLALVGCAWVDDPAVKGLPWEIVLNAAEYTHLRETAALAGMMVAARATNPATDDEPADEEPGALAAMLRVAREIDAAARTA